MKTKGNEDLLEGRKYKYKDSRKDKVRVDSLKRLQNWQIIRKKKEKAW